MQRSVHWTMTSSRYWKRFEFHFTSETYRNFNFIIPIVVFSIVFFFDAKVEPDAKDTTKKEYEKMLQHLKIAANNSLSTFNKCSTAYHESTKIYHHKMDEKTNMTKQTTSLIETAFNEIHESCKKEAFKMVCLPKNSTNFHFATFSYESKF